MKHKDYLILALLSVLAYVAIMVAAYLAFHTPGVGQ